MASKLNPVAAGQRSRSISRRALLRALGLGVAGALGSMPRTRVAAGGPANVSITYMPSSSVKLEQLIGDVDYAALAKGMNLPTVSQTVTNYNVAGTDLGSSFEHQGQLIFLFGDTISNDPSMPWSTSSAPFVQYRAGDAFAWSTTTDGEAGLLLNLFTKAAGIPLFVQPPGVNMGADDVPNAGISLNGQIYLVCNTGSDVTQSNPHLNDFSVLARFDQSSQTFTTGRTISKMPDGHFIITSLHDLPAGLGVAQPSVLMFGLGPYRATDVYLALIPVSGFESGAGTSYFTGLSQGQPSWSDQEADALPVVTDVVTPPTIGNVSVTYSGDLSLWLMTFDGGRPSEATTGVYFAYAPAPWGPWSSPQLIFSAVRDKGIGDFISDYDARHPNVAGSPAGPMIGKNDIAHTRGGVYAPYVIERFTKVAGNLLTIYYTMSTWNPYTIIKMRSQFQITPAQQLPSGARPRGNPEEEQGPWPIAFSQI